MKWCIIGAGGIADRRTIPAILSDKNNKIVAIMDKNAELIKNLSLKYGVKGYTDEEEMLSKEDCDCVYIGTPVFCHYSNAMTALKFNKHAFIEKPIGLNAKEGYEILSAFKKADKQLFVGYMMKYHNLHIKAKDIIANNGIGQVGSIRLQFTCWYPDIKGAWRQNKKLSGGGAIMDLGVHCLELAEFILNDKISEVKSFYVTRTFSYEVEDLAIIVFKTEGGVLGHIDVSFNVPDKASNSKLEIYGTKGNIICNNTLAQEEVGKLAYLYAPQEDYDAQQNRTDQKSKVYYGKKGNLYLKQIKEFSDLVKQPNRNYFYAERATHIQDIVDEIYAN